MAHNMLFTETITNFNSSGPMGLFKKLRKLRMKSISPTRLCGRLMISKSCGLAKTMGFKSSEILLDGFTQNSVHEIHISLIKDNR